MKTKPTATSFFDSILLLIINNKALSSGLINEKEKLTIDNKIRQQIGQTYAK